MRVGRGRRLERNGMGAFSAGIYGLAGGAGLMYWLDARSGARRRAALRQKAAHAGREVSQAVEVATRDLVNRSRGFVAEARAFFAGQRPDDGVLVERVRARLGRLSSHPGPIEVTSDERRVELSGPILAVEAQAVLTGVEQVPGVREVVDRLERHATADLPALQGGEGGPPRARFLSENWPPGLRIVAGTAGLALATVGRARGRLTGLTAILAGLGLVARAATNLRVARIVGVGTGGRAVNVRKAIHVEAPIEEVFAFFRAFENFPRFMTHVRDVRPIGADRWHWIVCGPAGVAVEWDAELTDLVPNQVIAWRSAEAAQVESSGVVRFEPEQGGTRIDVRMSYNPPAGALGHAIAGLFGANAKKQMDDDLLRFKSLLERGKATGHGGKVSRDEVAPRPPERRG